MSKREEKRAAAKAAREQKEADAENQQGEQDAGEGGEPEQTAGSDANVETKDNSEAGSEGAGDADKSQNQDPGVDEEEVEVLEGASVITNNHSVDLTLHTGIIVPAGKKVKVDDLAKYQGHQVFDAWCKAGIIECKEG